MLTIDDVASVEVDSECASVSAMHIADARLAEFYEEQKSAKGEFASDDKIAAAMSKRLSRPYSRGIIRYRRNAVALFPASPESELDVVAYLKVRNGNVSKYCDAVVRNSWPYSAALQPEVDKALERAAKAAKDGDGPGDNADGDDSPESPDNAGAAARALAKLGEALKACVKAHVPAATVQTMVDNAYAAQPQAALVTA